MHIRFFLIQGTILINILTTCITDAQMIKIPGGKFEMGSADGENDEAPVRTVELSPYSIMAKEVTEDQYDSCVREGKCTPAHYEDGVCRAWDGKRFKKIIIPSSSRGPGLPVVCITWYQAMQYCKAYGMSLPTEAQWEYVAKAGDSKSGTDRSVLSRRDGPQKINNRSPNSWGVYDMLGNVWEWIYDWYDPVSYTYDSGMDPKGSVVGLYRVIRGGGWYSNASQARVTNRQWFSPDFAEVSIGFRCVSP